MHAYVMQNWIRIPILLTLEQIEVGATTENITTIILQSIMKFRGLTEDQLASRWVCLGCDMDSMFQVHHIGIIMQVKENTTPYFIDVHYMVHRTNLAIVVFSKMPIMSHIETMLQSLYTFFVHSPKKFLEFVKLVETLATKGQKLLRNVKMRWISMLNPLKCIMSKYKSLIMKMHLDSSKTKAAQNNLVLFGDLELILPLPCLLPMLEVMHIFINFAQRQDVFIVEFMDAMKFAEVELLCLYITPYSCFEGPSFDAFNSLLNHTNQ